jgi:hypothetical protein
VPYEQLVNGVSLFFCVVDVSKGISKQIQTIVGLYYSVQDKAWFDERTVDNISAPYIATAPERIVLILFLDAFSVTRWNLLCRGSRHSELRWYQSLAVIPVSFSPVDGFNKPFKTAYCAPSLQLVDSADDDARNN